MNNAGRLVMVMLVLSGLFGNGTLYSAENAGQHFTSIWDGENGTGHMNIYVIGASIDGTPLQAGDEIAVFSSSLCVGTGQVQQTISEDQVESFVSIIASMDDGTGNGFTQNDSVLFKIWDASNNKEHLARTVSYRNDLPTWRTDGKYESGASSFVTLAAQSAVTQSIELKSGWNLISSNITPEDASMSSIMSELINNGELIKVKDQYGNTLESWGDLGGWINNIGDFDNTRGYQVYVSDDCLLKITGSPVDLPMDIILEEGWNTISFPYETTVDGENILHSLITDNVLVKAQDEQGNSIEFWGEETGWVNNIGVFEPGKAYEVKVSEAAILNIGQYYFKSEKMVAFELQPVHFIVESDGNGLEHMNINILSFAGLGLEAGDEIGLFDGDLCVGVAKLTASAIEDGKVSVTASRATPGMKNGFMPGGEITIKVWRERMDEELVMVPEIVDGDLIFQENESVFVKLTTATPNKPINLQKDVILYPNPASHWFNIKFADEIPQNAILQIMDISGKTITESSVINQLERMDVSGLPAGLYFVRLVYADNKRVWRLNIRK